jgi:hypothetical protein
MQDEPKTDPGDLHRQAVCDLGARQPTKQEFDGEGDHPLKGQRITGLAKPFRQEGKRSDSTCQEEADQEVNLVECLVPRCPERDESDRPFDEEAEQVGQQERYQEEEKKIELEDKGRSKQCADDEGGREDDDGHQDLVSDVVRNVAMDRVDGLEKNGGKRATANTVFVLVHDPGERELIDDHQDDVVGGKRFGRVATYLAATRRGDSRPHDEIDDGLDDAPDHVDRHTHAILEHLGERSLQVCEVD